MKEVRMSAPVFDQLNLVVRDMEATLRFYRAAGLDIPEASVWRTASGAHHVHVRMPSGVELEFDSAALAREYNRGWREPSESASRCVISFRMAEREAVDRLCGELAGLGYTVSQPPYDTFWGSRYAIVLDPDGHGVGFMSPADPARRSAPPDI
jgi:uncharacterized glyoxalase superfamily protein PhnB